LSEQRVHGRAVRISPAKIKAGREKKRDCIYIFFRFPIYSRHNLKKSKNRNKNQKPIVGTSFAWIFVLPRGSYDPPVFAYPSLRTRSQL
jgi:hypothetical protein